MTATRKAQNLNPRRAQKLNCFIVTDCFAKLKQTMEKLEVMSEPECIYNVDKGCRLCVHKQPLLPTQKRGKRVNLVAAEHGDKVTIMSCGNAVGSAILPMILFEGQRMKGKRLD
jgi:hypothetical protein